MTYSRICNYRRTGISGEVGKIWWQHNFQSAIFTGQIMSANNYSFFYFAHFRSRRHFLPVQSQQRKLQKKGWNLCNIRMHNYYLMYLRPGFDTKNLLVILFINWSNMFGCLNEVKKWKINLPGNKSKVSQKFYENQQVREKDF